MVKPAPKIDRRAAAEITEQVQELLVKYAPAWQEFDLDPLTGKRQPRGISAALIGVFARFAEITIQRLNQVPDKNFLAFLNLLGASRLPPQPARVPLTFSLATGSTTDAVVPAGTQVAAPPAEGEKDPVIFETERELVVTAAELTSVWVRDPEQDTYGDRSSIITTASSFGIPVFRGNRSIEHILYLGHSQLLGLPQISELKLKFTLLSSPLEDNRQLKWEFWDGEAWQEKTPTDDRTENLKQSGTIDLDSIQSIPASTVNLQESRWLRCRLVTPITLATQPRAGMVRASQLPKIQALTLEAHLKRTDLEIETAFTNQLPIDLSKDFFPFGEKPKFGDTLYLANSEAFSAFAKNDAIVTIKLNLTNPASGIPRTFIKGNPKLKWEFWNDKKWVEIGTSTREESLPAGDNTFEDTTMAFTGGPKVFLSSNGAYIDHTEEASTSDGTSFDLLNQNENNFLYLGATAPFENIDFSFSEEGQGEGYQLKFEYSKASDQWNELSAEEHNLNDGTSNWSTDGLVEFTIPDDWEQTAVNAVTRYWICISTTSAPTKIAKALHIFFQAGYGHVRFKFPEAPVARTVNGVEDFWLRVRIVAGNYGKEASYKPSDQSETGYDFQPATFAPPSIGSIKVSYELQKEEQPEVILTYNDFIYSENPNRVFGGKVFLLSNDTDIDYTEEASTSDGTPFNLNQNDNDFLYLGATAPFENIDFSFSEEGQGEGYQLKFEYSKASDQWNELSAEEHNLNDGTSNWSTDGLVEFTIPDDWEQTAVNAVTRYWICISTTSAPTKIAKALHIFFFQTFTPFTAVQESKPTVYLGFTLPPGRTDFPNRTISLFNRVADFKYGEKLIPISPTQSKMFGAPGSNVTHKFWLTNAATEPVNFRLSILGTRWGTMIVPESLDIKAGEAREVEVQVIILENQPPDSRDRGFLQLTKSDEPDVGYSATFETFASSELPASEPLQLPWQYWNGIEWAKLTVRDESENFTRSGLLQFLPPADITPREEFGLSLRYWLRVQWKEGDYIIEPRLQQLLPNTTMAAQTVTIRNEILGSSIGSENQLFRTVRAPVLEGQHLEVREPELPSAEERAVIQQEEGKDAVPAVEPMERPQEIWVRWHEVLDFYGSKPRDRHYVLNHLTGEIQFGNGLNGLIPPVGIGNLRMARYQTGGGTAGNKPADTIVQLKTTVPYVERVTNPEAATGGAEAETLDSLRDRMPRTLRHRGRAVTLEDYEDLAKQASPAVARTKCIPLRNLAEDSLGEVLKPGNISIIIVPRSTNTKPLPSLELLDRVQSFLKANGTPTANVSVVGPLYVSVNVRAEIALTALEGASAVEQAVYQTLDRFLHPLTGGLDGTGWDFGREPYKSDFYALIESVPGVDHIRTLDVTPIEDQPRVRETEHFLVYSGQHNISLVFEKS